MPKRAASAKIKVSWQLKIELLDVTPTVWRRLIVPETIKLPKLDRAIQAAFGWTNSHLHEFIIAGVRYAYPDPEWAAELKQVDETRIVLLDALGYEARSFDYVYDFGDPLASCRDRGRSAYPNFPNIPGPLQRRRKRLSSRGRRRCAWICRIPRGNRRSRSRGARALRHLVRRQVRSEAS